MARVKLKDVRLSFADLFEAKSFDGNSQPKFGATFLLERGSENETLMKEAIKTVAKEKWGKDAKTVMEKAAKEGKELLRNGDDKDYDGFAGMIFFKASNPTRPTIIDKDKTPLDSSDGKPYSGCYVNASIEVWAQDNKYAKRVNAQLRGVMFSKDGDPFSGGGVATEDEFDAFESEETEDEFEF